MLDALPTAPTDHLTFWTVDQSQRSTPFHSSLTPLLWLIYLAKWNGREKMERCD